jgi:nudix-type nucleoside diphosphatase (YffH/AdpP family)
MDDQKNGAVRIHGRQVLSDAWYKLEKVSFEQIGQDGRPETQEREVYHNGPGAAVLPIDRARGTVLLVRQLRVAAMVNGDEPLLVEACAGMVDEGDDPAETVRKEAEQEMGYRLRSIHKLFTLYMSPGASAEKLHLFTATYEPGDKVAAGGGEASEGEKIDVLELPLARAWEMVTTGAIVDAKTVLMLQHARLNDVGSPVD